MPFFLIIFSWTVTWTVTILLKQGQDCVYIAFEYLQGGSFHSLPGQPVPVLGHPHSKKCFLIFRGNIPCFSLCSLPLDLSLGTTEKSLALSSLHLPFSYLYMLTRSPWAFSPLGWTVTALSPSSQERCSRPLIIFMALCGTLSNMFMSLLYWGAQIWTQRSRWGLTRWGG